MAYDDYACLRVEPEDGVAFVTLDHPPLNLFDAPMIGELFRLAGELEADPGTRVAVFRSADPEFFLAHADVRDILRLPPASPGRRPDRLHPVHAFMERWRTLPTVTIAQLEGRARGGGSEFALSLDLRFAATGRAVLGQPEVAIGIIPGAGGTQRLARLIGTGRALEAVLGCDDFDAETAERYGWVNRALPPAEIGPFVERLARRIASFPPAAVRAAKAAVLGASPDPSPGLLEEQRLFGEARSASGADERIRRALERGLQTREVEVGLGAWVGEVQGLAEEG